jgi:hypothetical protein
MQPGGGTSIEMTSPGHPISIRRYRVQTSARPYEHLKRSVGASEIHYFVDEVGRGVVSGTQRHHLNFYAVCRRELGDLACIEMYYHADLQGEYAAIIADTARSFLDER